MSTYFDPKNGTTLKLLRAVRNTRSRSPQASPNEFRQIGIGDPISIALITVYAGDYKNGLFGSKKDMLVCSSVKLPHLVSKGAKCVNQIYTNVAERQALSPEAGNDGAPIIYYSPSFVAEGLMLTVEFKFDNYNPDLLDKVGSAFKAAAGLPLFAPSSGAFLLAGMGLKIINPILNSLFDKGPSWLKFNFGLVFESGGMHPIEAGLYLIGNETDLSQGEFDDFEIEVSPSLSNLCRLKRKGTGDGTGQAAEYYSGSKPYGIIAIDGREDEHLSDFAGALASAEVLEKFFGVRAAGAFDEDVKNILHLSNDYYYQLQIKNLKKQLEKAAEGSDEYKTLMEKIEAYRKNLQGDAFKGI